MTNPPLPPPEAPEPPEDFMSHLVELRTRLLYMIGAVTLVFLLLLPFSGTVYSAFARPVLASLLQGQTMLAQDGIDIFLTPLKVCLLVAVLLTIPFLLYQIWAYVAPALLPSEKRFARPLLLSATLLFYLGVLFAYFVILPLMFHFFSGIQLEGVSFMPDISRYLSISTAMFLVFGLVFEVPVALIILVLLGLLQPAKLRRQRPYVLLAAFTIGAILTPPDVISQTLLAVPLYGMFELGLWLAEKLRPEIAKTEK